MRNGKSRARMAFSVALGVVCSVLQAADRGRGGTVCAPDGSVIGKQWLFVVGIDQYQDARFPDLRCAVGDAKAVKSVCTERYLFDEAVELYNEQATRRAIIARLRDLAERAEPNDSLLIYYAGHGHLDRVLSTGFWIPHDGRKDDDSTWVANDRIRRYLSQRTIKAKHILLVSDSCFAGDFFAGSRTIQPIADPYARRAYSKTSRQAMTSGDLEPVADGPFARFFVRALRENRKPYLTPTSVFERITDGVGLATVKQTPLMGYIGGTDSERGQFVFFLKQPETVTGKPDTKAWERQREETERRRREYERTKAAEEGRQRLLAAAQKQFELVKKCDAAAYYQSAEKAELWEAYLRDFGSAGHETTYARQRLDYWKTYRPPTPTSSPAKGKSYTNPTDGSHMIYVPAGTFKMGGKERHEGGMVHDVHVEAFYISKYEITNKQFKKFVDANPEWRKGRVHSRKYYLKHWEGDSYPSDKADHPVVYVSWFAARAYCKWAEVRLPTEAEWEKACRAGSTGKYCFGDDKSKLEDYAWYPDNSHRSTHPVGQKRANEWGIHDMHGNVREWTSSTYKDYPYKANDGREDSNDTGSRRVLRGGGWGYSASGCRSAGRANGSPAYGGNDAGLGFRVVVSARAPK